MLGGYDLTKIV